MKSCTTRRSRKTYAAVTLNAVRHGILSRHVVLPHEDRAEFDGLLASLIAEHNPSGPTEMHLVEEIASIIWRKRRVLQAEYVDMNKSLARAARQAISVLDAALPFQQNLWDSGEDLSMIIDMHADDAQESADEAMAEMRQIDSVIRILNDNGEKSYRRAIKALPNDWELVWQNYLIESCTQENGTELKQFLERRAIPALLQIYRAGQHHQVVKAQAHGEGLQADQLEKLVRYESHLDRKLERILAMLLKLKELRPAAPEK